MVMDSQTLPKLPVIDFCGEAVIMGTSSWVSTCNDVKQALEEYGCFEAVYTKISPELQTAIYHAMEDLFDLPTETKSAYTSDVPVYGYSGPSAHAPIRESINIKDPTTFEETQSFTNLMWPQGNELYRETIYSYSKQISELDQMVTKMVFEKYGVEKYHEPHLKSIFLALRIIKYRGPDMKESNVGTGPHVDMSFTTVLHQNQVSGLEIQTKEGKWIQWAPSANSSYIVMAGHPFTAWSNGRIHSPLHRVIMHGNKARYSLALFSYNNGIVQTPEELVDEEHPLLFKPFDHLQSVISFLESKGTNIPN